MPWPGAVATAVLMLLRQVCVRKETVILLPQIAAAPEASGYGLGLSTLKVGLVLLPTSIAAFAAGRIGGHIVDRAGARALVAAGSAFAVVGYASLALAHDSAFELSAGSAVIGVGWGLVLTGIYPVVIRGSTTDKTGVAIGVNVVIRNTAAAVGTQVSLAIVTAAGLVGGFTAEPASPTRSCSALPVPPWCSWPRRCCRVVWGAPSGAP